MAKQAPSKNHQEIIKLVNARKIYQMGTEEVKALAGVDITFKKGSFWAIMGPSGSGKSTMMNILGCLDRLTSGSYYLDGKDVSQLDDDSLSDFRLRYLGFIFQSFNLIPELDVFDNVDVPLRYRGFNAAERKKRIDRVVDMVGLGSRQKHLPSQLSGGQQQRVAIARALAGDPRFLLADEPTGNLDSEMAESVMQLLESINNDGTTIIMVTHEPNLADRAKRNISVRDGQIESTEPNLHVAAGS